MAIFSAFGTAHAQDGANDDRENRRHKHKDMEVMVATALALLSILKAPALFRHRQKRIITAFYKDLTDAMTDAGRCSNWRW